MGLSLHTQLPCTCQHTAAKVLHSCCLQAQGPSRPTDCESQPRPAPALLLHRSAAAQLSQPRPASWSPPDPGRGQHIEHRRTVSLQHTPLLRVLGQPAATPPMQQQQGCFFGPAQQQAVPQFAAAQAPRSWLPGTGQTETYTNKQNTSYPEQFSGRLCCFAQAGPRFDPAQCGEACVLRRGLRWLRPKTRTPARLASLT